MRCLAAAGMGDGLWKRSGDVANDYISITEAARRFGLHANTIARLLRRGMLQGYKTTSQGGASRWLVSVHSLRRYTDPVTGFALDMPGPKLFLSRLDEGEGDDTVTR